MYPEEDATSFRLQDLVEMSGKTIEDFSETGANFRVDITIKCDVAIGINICDRDMSVEYIDTGLRQTPFGDVKAQAYRESIIQITDNANRKVQSMIGMNFLVSVTAIGSEFSYNNMVIAVNSIPYV
jgi:hypothetical protein